MASEKKRKRNTQKMKIYKEEVSHKKSSRINGPIKMKDVFSNYLSDDRKLVSDIMKMGVLCNDINGSTGSSSTSRSSSVVVSSTNNNNNNSLDMIKSMKQDEQNAAWILSGQITQVKFMPTQNMRMVVFGNEYGNIGFWNMDHHHPIEEDYDDHRKKSSDNGIYVYRPHPAFISGISIHPFSLCKIISSCYDGYIRVLDVTNESFDLAYKSDELITSICSPYNDINALIFGESNGDVTTLDLRSSKPTSSWSLHEDKVYTIDFNSQNTNIMVTGSKDDTACIWDLRKVDSKPLKMIRHDHHVNSAYFSPSGIYLATTSKDDCIGIVNASNYDVECMLYHSNSTGRSISTIRGIWGWDDCHIMVANKGNKGVDIISANEQQLLYTLESSHINAIPCRLDAHPMIPGLLAGSTGGGRVYVWDT